MKLHVYTNEIIDIAKANGMSWDIGANMFIANARNSIDKDLPYYYGAEDVNFEALYQFADELEESKPDFVRDYRKHEKEIIALRKQGDYAGIVALMEG